MNALFTAWAQQRGIARGSRVGFATEVGSLAQQTALNGANAFLNGAAPGGSGIGGGVLIMTEAADTLRLRVMGDDQSSSVGGGAIDVGRRFGTDNAWARYG